MQALGPSQTPTFLNFNPLPENGLTGGAATVKD
jgi:hypothetical protein